LWCSYLCGAFGQPREFHHARVTADPALGGKSVTGGQLDVAGALATAG
jgi:hypothetical protein